MLLTNPKNKQRLINFICTGLDSQEIETKQPPEVVECLFVMTTLEKNKEYKHVIIAGDDVDVLVLLNGLSSSIQYIFFQKSRSDGTDCGMKQFVSSSNYHH